MTITYASDFGTLANKATGGGSASPESLIVWIDNRDGAAAADTPAIGKWTSLWKYNKHPNGEGATPAGAAVPTGATAGGVPITAATGGRTKYLLSATLYATQFVGGMVYDRLLHNGGLSGTSALAQTVGGTLTRNTGGAGNFIALEIYTIIGSTPQTVTASYTDQDGNPGTTQAITIGGTGFREAGNVFILPLADGDTGVRAVASVTLSGSTGTAGNFGITIGRRLMDLDTSSNTFIDFPRSVSLETDTCLAFMLMQSSATASRSYIQLEMLEA